MDSNALVIRDLFSRIAPVYDLFNRLFSLGLDVSWRKHLVEQILSHQPQDVLDLATGSGDVALLLQKNKLNVMGADFCPPLLQKASQRGVKKLLTADALQIPLADSTVDAVTTAFGFRNFTDRTRALKEIQRVLRPGGWLHILEFSHPTGIFRRPYFFYLGTVMPRVTKIFCGESSAYHYLSTSILEFPDQQALVSLLENTGFRDVRFQNWTAGIVAIHSAQKPKD